MRDSSWSARVVVAVKATRAGAGVHLPAAARPADASAPRPISNPRRQPASSACHSRFSAPSLNAVPPIPGWSRGPLLDPARRGTGDQNSIDHRDKRALTFHRQNILA